MSKELIPIFICTPFIGQGDIHNEEWIDGRIALFEAVTKNSVSQLLGERIHWGLFLGQNPSEKVVSYAEKSFADNPRVHLLFNRLSGDNVVSFTKQNSEMEHFLTMTIADDDAWPKNYFSLVREKANELMEKGDFHAGLTFSNGLEWLMCDQVDIDWLDQSGFPIVRKRNLIEYNYEWLGFCYFILQTLSRPFTRLGIAHTKVAEELKRQNFSVHVSEEPRRAWLYNRHQLADSSLVKSENQPLKFTLDELELEFGINSKKVAEWPESRFGSVYCQKHAQGSGLLKLYDFPDLTKYVQVPAKYVYAQKGFFIFDPFIDNNISGVCRLRIYDETINEYMLLITLEIEKSKRLYFDLSLFDKNHSYKYDIQKWNGTSWDRVMPFTYLRFEEYLYSDTALEQIEPIIDLKSIEHIEETCKLRILDKNKKEYFFHLTLDGEKLKSAKLNHSILRSDSELSFQIHKLVEGKWDLIHSGSV
tara:strand:+ start:817 stop:2241 length:1425 start_codon:yes stop_codon:yes gene_type:complete